MGKITIIGAGNGGCTYAAYLGKRGHEVCLYEVPELADNLKDVIELGGFEMRGCDTGLVLWPNALRTFRKRLLEWIIFW